MNINTRQRIWLRATRKYQKLINTFDGTSFIRRKMDILRRRILHMNRAWKLGIATASLITWLSAPVMGQFPAVLELSDLNGTNGFVINGEAASDQLGGSVALAGDINEDGIDDIIIGAYRATVNGNVDTGKTYVVFGSSLGTFNTGSFNLSTLDGNNGFVLNGVAINDFSGFSVSSAGDINNDGIHDVIIGSLPNSYGRAGQTYVVFGNSTGFTSSLDLSALDGNNGFLINGIDPYDGAGRSVSSAGDINGDGIDDVLIGVPYELFSYVIFGNSTGFSSSLDLGNVNASSGLSLNNIPNRRNFGWSVSSAGDVNGDGLNDIIIGDNSADSNGNLATGVSYVVFGNSTGGFYSGGVAVSFLDGSDGFAINGIDAFDQSGWSVASAGDVNGDGIDDILVGAIRASPSGNAQAGECYVVFGSSTGFSSSFDLSALDGSNGFIVNGIDASDFSGRSVSVGDLNDDGFDDFMIAAASADPNGVGSGESYVIFGNSTGFNSSLDLSSLNGNNGFTINGINPSDAAASSVSAGDLNGDGINDLFIGAIGGDPNGIYNAGETYVIFGQPKPTLSLSVSPTSVSENASQSITYTFQSTETQLNTIEITFSISGSASPSTDFTLSGESSFNPMTGRGTIAIPQGSNSAVLTVTPIGDAVVEPDETVIITIENP